MRSDPAFDGCGLGVNYGNRGRRTRLHWRLCRRVVVSSLDSGDRIRDVRFVRNRSIRFCRIVSAEISGLLLSAGCGVGRAAIRGGARGVLGVAWRWFGRILRRLMDSRTVTKPLDISAFDTASLKERLGGLRRYL